MMFLSAARSFIMGLSCLTLCYATQPITVAFILSTTNEFITLENDTDIDQHISALNGKKSLICFIKDNLHITKNATMHALSESLSTILTEPNWKVTLEDIEDTSITSPSVSYQRYTSGGEDGEGLYLFENTPIIPSNQQNVLEYAYSKRDIQSKQGIFLINNGQKLHHTEPKALSRILELSQNSNPRHVIIISHLDMCPCCSRLLIGTFQSKRQSIVDSFPTTFFVISQSVLREFEDENKLRIRDYLEKVETHTTDSAKFQRNRTYNVENKIIQNDIDNIEKLKAFLAIPRDKRIPDLENNLNLLHKCLIINKRIKQIMDDLHPHGQTHNTLIQLIYS